MLQASLKQDRQNRIEIYLVGYFLKNIMKKISIRKTETLLLVFCLILVSACGKNTDRSRQNDEVSFDNVVFKCEDTTIVDDYIAGGMKPDRGLLAAAASGCLPVFDRLVNKVNNKKVLAEALSAAIDGIPSPDRNKIIEKLLAKEIDINTQLPGGNSYLKLAVKNNNLTAVKKLLPSVANSDRSDILNSTIRKRSRVSPDNLNTNSVLLEAVKNENFAIVKVLLENGIDANDSKNGDSDALVEAAKNNSVEIVEILLSKGAKLNQNRQKISLILENALKKNRIEIAIALIQAGANPNTKFLENRNTILSHAAAKGEIKLVKLLLKKGAKVNDLNGKESLALLKAVRYKQSKIVAQLLSAGANPNTKNGHNSYSKTVLTIATRNSDRATVKILLENGANPNDNISDRSSYALYIAADRDESEIVKLLLNNGAKDLNKRHDDPALRKAFERGNAEIVRLLIETEANPKTLEYRGFGLDLTQLAKEYSNSPINQAKYTEIATILEAATYVRQGILSKKNGELIKAKKDFDRAIKIDPESASAYLFRAQLKSKLSDRTGAKKDLEKAQKLYQKIGLIKYFISLEK